MYNLIFKKAAKKYYHKASVDTKKRLNKVFDILSKGEISKLDIKPLKGELKGVYRIRVGNLRIFYELINDENIDVLTVLPRGDAY